MIRTVTLVLAFVLHQIISGQVELKTLSGPIDNSKLLLGYNGRSTEGPSWENADFLQLINDSQANIFRYPAGTQANYWDWRYGTFIEGSGKSSPYDFTIPMFVNGLSEYAQCIYVINMARPTPSSGITIDADEATLKSESTLQLKIEDILDALDAFEAAGQLPYAVELGNEFYFSNEHAAIYAGDPVFYLQHSKLIATAIKANYPGVKTLLITTKGGTTSRDNWNNTVFTTLENDPDFAALIHGVVQHHYINDNYGDPSLVTDNQTAMTAISEGINYSVDKTDDYNVVPDNFGLWLTEYGATKANAVGTWASGLRAVALSMGWLKLGDKVENLSYHHITDAPDVINKDIIALGPVGTAMSYLYRAANTAMLRWNIEIQNNPLLPNGTGSLHGLKFNSSTQEKVLLINIGEKNINNIDLHNVLSIADTYHCYQAWSSSVYQSPVYRSNGISEENYQSDGTIDLKPFSITLITVDKRNTGLYNHSEINSDVSMHWKKNTKTFSINISELIRNPKLKVYTVNGQLADKHNLHKGENTIQLTVASGIYLCVIESDVVIKTFKIKL